MIVVRGKKTSYTSRQQLDALTAGYDGVAVDLEATDGMQAYRFARARPQELLIAVTRRREDVAEVSARAARNEEHGGVPNLLYVAADIEDAPHALARVAREVFVSLPSGPLLRGILAGDDAVVGGVVSLGVHGAKITIVLTDRPDDASRPGSVATLPAITPLYTRDIIAPVFSAHGARVSKAQWLADADIAKLEAAWVRRLSRQADARLFRIDAKVSAPPARAS